MKNLYSSLIFFFLLSNLLAQNNLPPSNDVCSSVTNLAVNISCVGKLGSTVNATGSSPACDTLWRADDDVWYRFTATKTSMLLTILPSEYFDPAVEVFAKGCDTLQSVFCQNRRFVGETEKGELTGLQIGKSYLVRVYHTGTGFGSGAFSICVSTPTVDICEGAQEIIPTNGVFSYQTISMIGASLDANFNCSNENVDNQFLVPDVWAKFVATSNYANLNLPSPPFSASLSVFDGSECDSLRVLLCGPNLNSNIYLSELIVGKTYYIRVTGRKYNTTVVSSFQIGIRNYSPTFGESVQTAIPISSLPYKNDTTTYGSTKSFYFFPCEGDNNPGSVVAVANFLGGYKIFKVDIQTVPSSYYINPGAIVVKGKPNHPYAINQSDCRSSSNAFPYTFSTPGDYYLFFPNLGSAKKIGLIIDSFPKIKLSNDSCKGAIPITVSSPNQPLKQVPINFEGATEEGMGCIGMAPDVWFSFIAKNDTLEIKNEDFDSRMYWEVYKGSCDNLNLFNRCGPLNQFNQDLYQILRRPRMTGFEVGEKYYLRATTGNYKFKTQIAIKEPDLPIYRNTNDSCFEAILIPVKPKTDLSGIFFHNFLSKKPAGSGCVPDSNAVAWFKFTSPYPLLDFATHTFLDKPYFKLFSNSCGSLVELLCDTAPRRIRTNNGANGRRISVLPGQTYYLAIYGSLGNLPDETVSIYLNELDTIRTGRTCQNPFLINSLPYTFKAFQANNYSDPPSCSVSNLGADMYFKFATTEANSQIKVTYRRNSENSKYWLRFGNNCSCSYFSTVTRSNNFTQPDSASHILDIPVAGTYYIRVEKNGSTDPLDFSLAKWVPPGNVIANDKCNQPLTISTNDTTGVVGILKNATYDMDTPGGIFSGTNLGTSSDYEESYNVDVWFQTVITDANFNIRLRNLSSAKIGINITLGDYCTTNLYVTDFANIVLEPGENERILKIREQPWAIGRIMKIRVFAQSAFTGNGNFNLAIFPASVINYPTACAKVIPISTFPFDSGLRTTCGKGSVANMIYEGVKGLGEEEVFRIQSIGKPLFYKITGPLSERSWYNISSCAPSDVFVGGPGWSPQFTPNIFDANFTDTAHFQQRTLPVGPQHIFMDHPKRGSCSSYRLQIWDTYASNDKCSNAKSIPAQTTTLNYQEELFERVDSNDLYYKFVPTTRNGVFYLIGFSNGNDDLQALFFSQCPRGANQYFYLYGNPNLINSVNSQVARPPFLISKSDTIKYVFNQLVPGQPIWVRISMGLDFSSNGWGGLFKIAYQNLSFPINDDCQGAVGLTATNGTQFTNSNSILGNPSFLGCIGNADDDVWFRFTATNARTKIIIRSDSLYDPVFELFTGTCGNLQSMVCKNQYAIGQNEATELTNLVPGNTYFIRVYHSGDLWSTGKFGIAIQNLPTAPANDECLGAISIISNTNCQFTNGNNANATTSLAACSGSEASDVWFKFVATNKAHQIRVQSGANFDAVVQAFSGNCTGLTPIGLCRDSSTVNGLEVLKISGLTIGQTYFFRVYNYFGRSGNQFQVCVTPDFSLKLSNLEFENGISNFCTPKQVQLQFRWLGDVRTGNQFRLQLSDSLGSFSSPVQIGFFSGTPSFPVQLITGTLPAVSGTGYKLRVVSTDLVSVSNDIDFQANAIPNPPSVTPISAGVCEGTKAPTLRASGNNLQWFSSSALSQQIASGDSLKIPTLVSGQRKFYITQSRNGCQSQAATITINFSEKPAPPVFTLPQGNKICQGDSLQILASGSGQVNWQNGFSGNALWVKYPGIYKASVTNAIGCKGDTSSVLIGQKSRPAKPIILASATNACSGDSILVLAPAGFASYRWSTGSTINKTLVYNSATVFLQIADTSGCFSAPSDSVSVVFHAKPDATISLQSGSNVCEGDTVTLSVPLQGNVSYAWFRNNSSLSAATTSQLLVLQSGNYQAKVSTSQCQSFSDQRFVTFSVNPAVEILAAGGQLIVSSGAVSGALYIWLLDGSVIDTTQFPIFAPTISGSYQVKVVFPNGCLGQSTSLLITSAKARTARSETHIYPNPTSGKVQVISADPVSLNVFSITGKSLLESKASNRHQLDLRSFGSGMYIFEVWIKGKREVKKVLVE